MKLSILAAALVLIIGAPVRAQNTTYTWKGGAPGYSGTIVLDSPSSTGGSVSDIVSWVQSTPLFLNVADLSLVGSDAPFTWNSSEITSMDIFTTNFFFGPNLEAAAGVGGNVLAINDLILQEDTTGSWKAPDRGSTLGLLGMAVGGLSLFARFRRWAIS